MSYSPPAGNSVLFVLSDVYTPPTGDAVAFTQTSGGIQYILGSGFSAFSAGWVSAVSWRQYISPLGLASGAFGRIGGIYENFLISFTFEDSYTPPSPVNFQFAGGLSTVYAAGVGPGDFGAAFIALEGSVFVGGISPGGFGTPALGVEYYIRLGGLDYLKCGIPTVEHSRNILRPSGISALEFGGQFVSHAIRKVDLAGYGFDSSLYGSAAVALGTRTVFPRGIVRGGIGDHAVDRHHYLYQSGWDSSSFGAHRVHDNSQEILPEGISASLCGEPWASFKTRTITFLPYSLTSYGTAEVWNKTQIVTMINERGSNDGGVFGNWLTVLNRNRVVTTAGEQDSKFGAHDIYNKGRPVFPIGISGLWGDSLVAFAIRTVYTEGIHPRIISPYHSVLNGSRVIAPAAVDGEVHGGHSVENTRRYYKFVGRIPPGEFGVPFVAPAIRYVVVPMGPSVGIPSPEVQLFRRYVEPESISLLFSFGRPEVSERFNIIKTWSIWPRDQFGLPSLRNVTPEIRTIGYPQIAIGDHSVRHQYRHVYPEGIREGLWGRLRISDTRQVIKLQSINPLVFGLHEVRNEIPTEPWDRTLLPKDFIATFYGQPSVIRNEIHPDGIVATLFGNAVVTMMGCYPGSWKSSEFGTAWVRGPQYIFPETMPAPDDVRTIHDLSPRTIWATFDVTNQALANHDGMWELMDDVLDREDSSRPRFGCPVVSNYYRGITNVGAIAPKAVGEHSVENKNRRILADGLRSLRMGIPSIPFTEVVDQNEFGASFFEAGIPSLELQNKSVAPSAMDAVAFGDTRIENFHRELLVSGWDSFTSSGHRVHPPEPIIPSGLNATIWGATWVSKWIRTLDASGFDGLDMMSTPGSFKDRMRVANGSTVVGAKGMRSLESGVHSVVSVPIPVQSVDIIVEQQ